MVGWHHRFNRHEFEQAPGVGDGQGSLACYSPWDSQESSPTSQFKSINSSVLSFLYSPTLTSIHDHWKNHSFDLTFVSKVMSLLLGRGGVTLFR